MAKQAVKKVNRKAPKKVTKKKENPYIKRFFIGLVLVFSSILGMFNFGILGNWLTYGFEYLFGIYYLIVFISVFVMGFFLIIKKPLFKLRDTKTIGGLLIFVSLTTWSTMAKLVEIKGLDVINRFIESMKLAVKPFGGGLVGALFYAPMSSLFGSQGTLIALVIMIIIGATLIIGTAYLTFVKDRYKHYRENQKAQKEGRKQSQGIKDEEDLIENQPKLKIFNDQDFEQVDAITNLEIFENEEGEAIVETIDEVMVKETSTEPVIHSSMPLEIKDDEIVKEPKSTKAYRLPPLYLLKSNSVKANVRGNLAKAKENAQLLVQVMKQFGINVEITDIHIGPSVTKYEVKPEVGVRVNKIASLQDDIKMALSAKDIRIEAPIPGKPAVGIEIPNLESTMVTLKEVLQEAPKPEESNRLLVGLGRDIAGRPVNTHLDRTPHLLVAGATGSGKSVCINSIIVSLLMRTKPDEVKLLLVDPKKVELNVYNGVPHLLAPVVTDPKKAAVALRKIVIEMEARYELFSSAGVRNIKGYNAYLETKNQGVTEAEKIAPLPYIVAIVDELADLMMVASKDVEDAIMRITQMARAAGIHLIVATQRPSTDVITGIIKANIPSRIAFAVSSSIDSRTILDSSGAERLLGKGDMLFAPMGENHAVRIQGSFVSDEEVNTVVEYVAKQQPADFDDQFVKLEATEASGGIDSEDPLYEEIRDFIIDSQKASASLLQRRFSLGYNRAARLIDQLEEAGVIGPQNGSKPREVYIKKYQEEF